MLNKDQALIYARQTVEEMGKKYGLSLAIVEPDTLDTTFAWVFFYNSKEFVETGSDDVRLAGNGPIFVSKSNGAIKTGGSAKPVERQIKEYEAQIALGGNS